MFSIGCRDGFITLVKQADILIVRIHGDTRPDDIVAAFDLAHAKGWIGPNNRLLIDIRCFVGSVDWQSVRDLRRLAPWTQTADGKLPCAYLLGGTVRAWLVSIAAAFYPGIRHRIFQEEAQAMAWLAQDAIQRPVIYAGDGA